MVPLPYQVSIWLLIGCGALFICLVLCHLCSNYGLSNSHREISRRRQPHQKIEQNLRFAIFAQPIVPPVARSGLPLQRVVGPAIVSPKSPEASPKVLSRKAVRFVPSPHLENLSAEIGTQTQNYKECFVTSCLDRK
jgi:hypothetical protein